MSQQSTCATAIVASLAAGAALGTAATWYYLTNHGAGLSDTAAAGTQTAPASMPAAGASPEASMPSTPGVLSLQPSLNGDSSFRFMSNGNGSAPPSLPLSRSSSMSSIQAPPFTPRCADALLTFPEGTAW